MDQRKVKDMRFRMFVIAALCFALAIPAIAGELAGITMPDKETVEGKTLVLNGMGLRTKFFFKVYVAGLYLETKSSDANQIIASDQIRRVDMVMMRELGAGKITEAVEAGFEKNNKAQMGALRARLDKFNAGIKDLEDGDHLTVTYIPGKGTILSGKGGDDLVIEGKDFGDALFSVWLGQYPVDEKLKAGMLGS